MSRMERLMEVLIKLQTKPRFTVQEMADELGVSRRTMLRDLQALSEMGVPLAAAPGRYGGYRLITQRRLLPLSLTVDEAIGMVLSYEAFLQYAQSPFAAQSLSAITKLRNAMPPDVVRALDRIHQHVVVLGSEQRYSAPHLAEILRAAVDGVHLRIVYDSTSGESERLIFPYGLFASGTYPYRRRSPRLSCHNLRYVDEYLVTNVQMSCERTPVPARADTLSGVHALSRVREGCYLDGVWDRARACVGCRWVYRPGPVRPPDGHKPDGYSLREGFEKASRAQINVLIF
jgi:biotin operon repressor